MYDIDPQTGIIEHYNKGDNGKIKVVKTQDVQPFLQANAQSMNNSTSGFQGDWHKMASIPPIVIEIWTEELKAKGADNPNPLAVCNRQFLLGKLNSADWNKLRTKQGVI